MHISHISITNFRLLKDVQLSLEKRTTLIVGRNNSGKTSLTELFRRLLSDTVPSFRLEDFSLSAHQDFWKAFLLKSEGREENEIRDALPFIEVKLKIDYQDDLSNAGEIGAFIVDLDLENTVALVVIRYELKQGAIDAFFEGLTFEKEGPEQPQKTVLCRQIRDRLPELFGFSVHAVDPNDSTNKKMVEWSKVRALLQSGFINAQRGLDDITHRDRDVLGKILEALLKTASSESADPKDRQIAEQLEDAVRLMQEGIDVGFNKQLQELIPTFSLFGYPGLSDPGLSTETLLDVQRLLTDHTKVQYAGVNGINLPESYNGLGARNLIFILLKLLEFFKAFMTAEAGPGIHLVFIEEPEVHLHPQMQEVFISKLGDIAETFEKTFNQGHPWPVQFVVTTHSSHLANKAPFACIRYFLAKGDQHTSSIRSTQTKDLRQGLGGSPKEDQEFLHKYMTLTRCDLLFADKAMLIEGPTERLLLPRMIEKIEAEEPDSPKLSSQYISVVEVGGAYAHLFFDLLKFLELRTLVVTDLDTVNLDDNAKACMVSIGTHTSNACIKAWFGDSGVTASSLLNKSADEKTQGIRRLAYQVPHEAGRPCGRSFEEAFILANPVLFQLTGQPDGTMEEAACEKAKAVGQKTSFALKFAIENTTWSVPTYIAEGLRWLREETPGQAGTTSKPESLCT